MKKGQKTFWQSSATIPLVIIFGVDGPQMPLNTPKCVLEKLGKNYKIDIFGSFFPIMASTIDIFDLQHSESEEIHPTNCLQPFQVDEIPQNRSKNKCLILVPIFS